jgi:hypothetical protein
LGDAAEKVVETARYPAAMRGPRSRDETKSLYDETLLRLRRQIPETIAA